MPRQTFLSKESFVVATEKQTRDALLSIPVFVNNIKLLAENKMIESVKFSYEQPVKNLHYHVDVTVLPLNDQYTRVSFHASHANGHAFYSDADMAFALHDFESAIHAAVKGDLSYYQPYQPKQPTAARWAQWLSSVKASVAVMFLKKKLS